MDGDDDDGGGLCWKWDEPWYGERGTCWIEGGARSRSGSPLMPLRLWRRIIWLVQFDGPEGR